MNANEREQLTHLLNQLREAKVGERDAEADRLIRDAVAANADSSYLLVQRTLLLEQALSNAKGQIAQLQREVTQRQSQNQGGFLGRNNPWASDLGSTSGQSARQPGSAGYQLPPAAPASGSGSSFLGNLATTAAGVVAGSFLFQGIENLLGHHSSPSGFGSTGEDIAGDTIINNYYGAEDEGAWSQADANSDLAADSFESFDDGGSLIDDGDDSSWV
jgi:hypothetical protein